MKYDYEEQFVEALKGITDNNLKKKLVAIKKLVCERMALEKEFKKEHNKLQYKYEELYKPFYERRQKIIPVKIVMKSLKNFLKNQKNHHFPYFLLYQISQCLLLLHF